MSKAMKIDYNKFTEQELQVIIEAARAINFAFGQQFPSYNEQVALLIEDLHFRCINQIIIQAHNAILAHAYRRENNPDA